ncbi:hypothetical protein F5Y16DRAFT_394947 [Xylariaceae sp. FL0255]|nr:hypothetical protein F5Y16DRAFT_394947 [Xylariaceae sp. FL0255]
MPRRVQDAYSAISLYTDSRTRENTSTVHMILEKRTKQLLRTYGSPDFNSNFSFNTFDEQQEEEKGQSIRPSNKSRVQALLGYQVARLFDGDVRMRAQAEEVTSTLFSWNRQILDSVKDSLRHPERSFISSSSSLSSSSSPPFFDNREAQDQAIWRAWILAESVRRT